MLSETTRLLRDLVCLPSVNPMGREVSAEIAFEYRVTAYLENFFRSLGVPYERQQVAPQRENIVARLDAAGARRTLMLEVHQDTVPVDGMTIAPFGAQLADGRLWGRGACDVKGGMAAMLVAFAQLVRERPRKRGNVILACTVDEEHSMLGVRELVKRCPHADFAVVAEPTQLRIVHAHKGIMRWYVSVPGRSCHSSAPEQGINAIYRTARLLSALEEYGEKLRADRVDPLLGPATLSVGRIEGGSSVNTVPDRCRLEIDRRLIPGEDSDSALRDLLAYIKPRLDFAIEVAPMGVETPALNPQGSEEIQRLLGVAIDAELGSHRVEPVPYGTDAATLAQAGIPSVIFGPGDVACAHTSDESIPLDEVEQAASILYRLASNIEAG